MGRKESNQTKSYKVDGCVNIKIDRTVTPVKTFTRIHLTPSTKEFLRIACGEKIENAQYRPD